MTMHKYISHVPISENNIITNARRYNLPLRVASCLILGKRAECRMIMSVVIMRLFDRDSFQRNFVCLLHFNTINTELWIFKWHLRKHILVGISSYCTAHYTIHFVTVRSKIGRQLDGRVENRLRRLNQHISNTMITYLLRLPGKYSATSKLL